MQFREPQIRIELNRTCQYKLNYKISYSGKGEIPQLNDLTDVLDNSDPLNLTQGNPKLKPYYNQNITTNITRTSSDFTKLLSINLWFGFSNSYIGQSILSFTNDTVINGTIVLPYGATYSKPVNIDGYRSFYGNLTYGFPIQKIKGNISVNMGTRISQIPTIVNNKRLYSIAQGLLSSARISSNFNEKIELNIKYSANYSITQNTVHNNSNSVLYTGILHSNLYLKPFSNLIIASDFLFTHYRGNNLTNRNNSMLLNCSIGYKFLKNKAGCIKLTGYDLLKSNKYFSRNSNTYYVEDVQQQVLENYYFITFSYNLQNLDNNINSK
jgi:hypothetical protein